MNAGFAKMKITPPLGTHLFGWGGRDLAHGCEGVNDDLFARALYLEHEGERALVVAFDLLFFDRADADRIKGAIGRALDLAPRQVLLNCSHTHDGPVVGSWAFAGYSNLRDGLYVDQLVAATVSAAAQAAGAARPARVRAGCGRTSLPVSRRLLDAEGKAQWAPNPTAPVCNDLPVALVEDLAGRCVCLLFSVACHPSTLSGFAVSADYPGATAGRLARRLGADVAAFLQGCGGDTKASVIADGDGGATWRRGTPQDVEQAGEIVSADVMRTIAAGLKEFPPAVATAIQEMHLPLGPPPAPGELEKAAATGDDIRRLWARRQLQRIGRGLTLPATAGVLVQAVQLARGVRLIALEGEPVAGFAPLIGRAFPKGVTFALGYSNGQGLYLPTEDMLPHGGYEVESYHEYGWPAGLVPGYEAILRRALAGFAAAHADERAEKMNHKGRKGHERKLKAQS